MRSPRCATQGSRSLFMGIIAFLGIWLLISQVLQMRLMGALLDKFINIGFIILVIIFQDEIKKIPGHHRLRPALA